MDKLKQKCTDAFTCDKDKKKDRKKKSLDDRWRDEEDEIVDGDEEDEIINNEIDEDQRSLEKDDGYEIDSKEAENQINLTGDHLKLKYDPYTTAAVAANTSLALYANYGNHGNHGLNRDDIGNHGLNRDEYYNRLHYGSVAHLRPRRGVWDSIVCFFKDIAGKSTHWFAAWL